MIQRAIMAVYSPAFIFISGTENHLLLMRASENPSVPHTINIQAVSPLALFSPLFFSFLKLWLYYIRVLGGYWDNTLYMNLEAS